MRRTAGFTLVEVLIAITIMVILLILSVISLQGSEMNARDEKRKTDISVIAQQLENYYTSGSNGDPTIGRYPGTDLMSTETLATGTLRDLDVKVLRAPGVASTSQMSLTMATTNSTTQLPNATTYIYQPLTGTGALCITTTSGCRKFNLYYKLEDPAVPATQVLTSKNQ
jgi:prepilin-type N-terminal cleavage/methylation domain-containing protein